MKNLFTLLLSVMAIIQVSAAGAAEPFHIVMVPWRGITDAEQGFMDYLKRRHVPVRYTFMDCQKDKSRLPGFVRQIKKIRPDLVYVFGTTGALGLCGRYDSLPDKKYLTDIPVVFNIVSVPVKSGLVTSMTTSGRNLTGTSHLVPLASQIKAINSFLPLKGLRLGVVYNPQEKNSLVAVAGLKEMSRTHDFTLIQEPFTLGTDNRPDVTAIPAVIDHLASRQVDMIYLPSDSFLVANGSAVVAAINRHGLPSFSATEVPIKKAGALTGLVSRYYNVGQLAGYKAEQILVEKKAPSDIPMETLSRFSFMVNMTTAKILDFYPPLTVLKFAEVLPPK
jgi:putative ABC transport system substrate-binding protein